MRMGQMEIPDAAELIKTALDCGIDHFDHADIYHGGRAEEIFRDAVRKLGLSRNQLIIQSKCGIRKGFFDFSRQHIVSSVEGSLVRLGIEQMDLLLLHRPDTLMEPDEVAGAFTSLRDAGKVREFGVSNQNPGQMTLLGNALPFPLVANQLQLSLAHTPVIDHGFNVNMANPPAIDRDGDVLNYCRLHSITIQAWSPLQFGFFGGVFLGHPDFKDLNAVLARVAAAHNSTPAAVAIAWILRHPARMQAILGSTNPGRIRDMAAAANIDLSREEWYELYRSAGNALP